MNNRLTPKEREYLAWVKSQPCALCGALAPSDAHHVRQPDLNMQELKPLHDLLEEDFPERVCEIAEYLFMVLAGDIELQHMGRVKLARLAKIQALRLGAELGGANLYLPVMKSGRDQEIWNRFNGTNYVELARIFGMTEMRVRQIVEKMRRVQKL